MTCEHVAIIGGGFSGALLAINLLRHDGPRATLIERRVHTARGVAYSAAHPDHLLNVRADNMSALPDDPGHFVRWLEKRGLPTGFAPRLVYGDYLDSLLRETLTRSAGRLTIIDGDAVNVVTERDGALATLADGRAVIADTVALAPGNLPPLVPAGLDPAILPPGVYRADPWRGGVGDRLGAEDTVLVLGSGLTMVDVALLLDAEGFAGRIVALSRHGLIPHAHAEGVPKTKRSERPEPTARAVVRAIRERSDEIEWRSAVDELRPFTQGLWRAASLKERQRFLRHVRPWWDIHRHRLAPSVAGKIRAMQASGKLEVIGGRLRETSAANGLARIAYTRRGHTDIDTIEASRIVNATGPQGDLTETADPLLRALAERGVIRPDPLRIGIDVDQDSRVIGADGCASQRLVAIGPMTRGAFWEIVAVPDIRRQAWSVARRLSNAQWVEGEGL